MKIALGQRGDYAVRAVVALAAAGERRKAREIAAQMQIPQKFLPQILGSLIRAGLLVSVAGPDGGYSLARSAAAISLLEVIEAVEGPVGSEKCVLRGGPCHWITRCAVHSSWSAAQEALVSKLRQTSLADLRREERRLSSLPATPQRRRATAQRPRAIGTPRRK